MDESRLKVPIWKKYSLSIEEASAYFGIGESKIRKIVSENPEENFFIEVGSRIRIKRELFAKYLDHISTL